MSINPFKSGRYALAVVVFLAATLAGPSGMAIAGEMKVNLSGDQEVPPVQTSASGSGTITVADDKSIKGTITVIDIKPSGVHIHEAPTGKTGDPIITLDGAWVYRLIGIEWLGIFAWLIWIDRAGRVLYRFIRSWIRPRSRAGTIRPICASRPIRAVLGRINHGDISRIFRQGIVGADNMPG